MGKSNQVSKEIGLYIHIPFCKSKCFYCDFNSFSGKENLFEDYFCALKKEIESYREKLNDYTIKSIFIGGGTPTYVNESYICEVMNFCKSCFNVRKDAEISIESNPGTLTYTKLVSYRQAGINRLSIGLQAWQNETLKRIGRIHNVEEFIENYHQARKAGFENINADVIFGLPQQSIEEWDETISKLIQLGLEHISCYSLKIEDNTQFGKMLSLGTIKPMEDEADREMYYNAISALTEAGYRHYEISNFAKPGLECQHNLIYWKAEEYVGVGAGAHSYMNGKRYGNVSEIEEYINCIETNVETEQNFETIDKKESMSEFMILGLRLIDGVSIKEFEDRFDEDLFKCFGSQIEQLIGRNFLILEGDRLRLTGLGLDMANEVFVEFIN